MQIVTEGLLKYTGGT